MLDFVRKRRRCFYCSCSSLLLAESSWPSCFLLLLLLLLLRFAVEAADAATVAVIVVVVVVLDNVLAGVHHMMRSSIKILYAAGAPVLSSVILAIEKSLQTQPFHSLISTKSRAANARARSAPRGSCVYKLVLSSSSCYAANPKAYHHQWHPQCRH